MNAKQLATLEFQTNALTPSQLKVVKNLLKDFSSEKVFAIVSDESSGKTTLAQSLEFALRSDHQVFYCRQKENPQDELESFQNVIEKLKLEYLPFFAPHALTTQSQEDVVRVLSAQIAQHSKAAHPIVLLIDDAEKMTESAFHLLGNLARTAKESFVKICLLTRTSDWQNISKTLAKYAQIQFDSRNLKLDYIDYLAFFRSINTDKALNDEQKTSLIKLSMGDLAVLKNLCFETLAGRFVPEKKHALDTELAQRVNWKIPESFQRSLDERISKLPDQTRSFLEVCSLWKSEVRIRVIADVMGIAPFEASENMYACARLGLLEAFETYLEFTHQSVRSRVLANISQEDLRRLHQKIGTALFKGSYQIVGVKQIAARHLIEAREFVEDGLRAEACAVAGKLALDVRAWKDAVTFLTVAKKSVPYSSDGSVYDQLGQAFFQLRLYDDAHKSFEKANQYTFDSLQKALVCSRQALVEDHRRNPREAFRHSQNALRNLGLEKWLEPRGLHKFFNLLIGCLRVSVSLISIPVYKILPRDFVLRREKVAASEHAIFETAGHVATYVLMPPLVILNIALRTLGKTFQSGSTWELTKMLAIFSYILCQLKLKFFSEQLYRLSERLARPQDYKMATFQILFYKAFSLLHLGKLKQAEDVFKSIMTPLTGAIPLDLGGKTTSAILMNLLLQGRMEEVQDSDKLMSEYYAYDKQNETASDSRDAFSRVFSTIVKRAAGDKTSKVPVHLFKEFPYNCDFTSSIFLMFGALNAHLERDWDLLTEIDNKAKNIELPPHHMPYFPRGFFVYRTRAYLQRLWDEPNTGKAQFENSLRDLKKAVQHDVLFETHFYLALGYSEYLKSNHRKARKLWKKSLELARKHTCIVVEIEASLWLHKLVGESLNGEEKLKLRDLVIQHKLQDYVIGCNELIG